MVEKKYLPIFLNLNRKECLVIGGGKIAKRKIQTLIEYGANITVISKVISDEIKSICSNYVEKEFEKSDILLSPTTTKYFFIVAATSSKETNLQIVEIAEKLNVLVNNITSKEEMNARFCTVLEIDGGVVGISGKGNPTKALEIKEKIKKI